MKTNHKLLIIACIAMLFFGNNLYAQQVHIITLEVDTDNIPNNLNDYSSYVNFGQASGISNADFSVNVALGDIVIWKGVSKNGTDKVNIKQINYHGGDNFFNENVLKGNGDKPEIVVGTIEKGSKGAENKYKLHFKVSNRNKTFIIDPKLKMPN